MNQYEINGNDAFTTFGLVFKEGSIEELMRLAERKPEYEFSWPDEDGTVRDVSDIKYQSKEMTIPCVLVGASKVDFSNKYNAFKAFIIGAGYFDLLAVEFGRRWTVLYQKMENYKQDDYNIASFNLILVDDYPHQTLPVA